MEANRLFTTERQLHRTTGEPREERGLRLDRHIFFPTEGAAIGDQLHEDLFLRRTQERSHLSPVVEDALSLRG